MLISSIAIENAILATCHYRQEELDKSIGACTNNHAASITHCTATILLARIYFFNTRYVLCLIKIDIINSSIFLTLLRLLNARCKRS